MFELHIDNPKVETGVVAVSWCVSRELLVRLNQLGIDDPHVLLVWGPSEYRYDPKKERRKLVPLKDGMSYIEFRSDGEHKVFAMIMFWWSGTDGMREFLFTSENGSWKSSVLRQDGSGIRDDFNNEQIKGTTPAHWGIIELSDDERSPYEKHGGWRCVKTSLRVEVPAGCFAKPPPAWEQAWVNHWFRQAPIDECEYRKRRLWAYSVQPPIMFLNWIIRLGLTILALVAGFRIASLRPLYSMLSTSMEDAFDNFLHGNFFWPKSWGKNPIGFCARLGLPVFTPISIGIVAMIVYATNGAAFDLSVFLKTCAIVLIGLFISIMIICLLFFSGLLGIGYALDRYDKRKTHQPVVRDYVKPEMIDYLSCETLAGQPRRFKNIPLKHRTVRLWFEDTKAKVCRPFAR